MSKTARTDSEIKKALVGFQFLVLGLRTVSENRSLVKFIIWPLLIDLILFFVGVFFFATSIPGWSNALVTWMIGAPVGFWGQVLFFLSLFLMFISLFLFLLLMIYLVAGLIASPFNNLLAESTLRTIGVKVVEHGSITAWVKANAHLLFVSLLKAIVLIAMSFSLFVFSLIPVLGVISIIGTMMILSYDVMDYSLECRNLHFRERFNFFRKNFSYFLGMGLALTLTVAIPGLTLLALPFGVVGAAVVYKRCIGE